MHIAIIGLGEVGRCYARALHAAGIALSLCNVRPSAAAVDCASSLALPLHTEPGAWLGQATWVLSCVPGTQSAGVVALVLPFLNREAAFADFSTAAPDVKRSNADAAAAQGSQYVDAAIMGAISLGGARTPLLLAGAGAEALQCVLAPCGARIRIVANGVAGDAMSLKLLRSVFTKGMEALAVELLMSAEQQGMREQLYAQLADIDETPLRDYLDMLVRTHVVHAARRVHEVRDAQALLAARQRPSLVLPGVERRFAATVLGLASDPLGDADPTLGQALDWLLAQR